MFSTLKNAVLCCRFPFLRNRRLCDDKKLDLKGTKLDWFPNGWRKTIAINMCKELKRALKKDHSLKDFRIYDIKEKYGTLRVSTNFTTDRVEAVMRRYELLSMCYCINCGKPVRYIKTGWINFICEDCAKLLTMQQNERVTVEHIPIGFKYEDNEVYECSDYSVNFFRLWDLRLSDYIKYIKEELNKDIITEQEFKLLVEWAEIVTNDISYIDLLTD